MITFHDLMKTAILEHKGRLLFWDKEHKVWRIRYREDEKRSDYTYNEECLHDALEHINKED